MLQCNIGGAKPTESGMGKIERRKMGGTAEKGVSTVPVHGDWGRGIPGLLTMRVAFRIS